MAKNELGKPNETDDQRTRGDKKLRIESLRNALIAGENSGVAIPFSMDQFLDSRFR
jgi:Arc/MetJ-type ribon-helix-helix transcriptional regulator